MASNISRRSLFAAGPAVLAASAAEPNRRLKVVVAGGHPDDPESGAGGAAARYARAGHEVVCLYLTRGEAGIKGKSHEEAARIRTAEAEAACKILGARAAFAGQVDGATEVNRERYDKFFYMLEGLQPDVVFTHFPIDTHRDHRAVSQLVFDSWQHSQRKFLLYYFEVLTGEQTQNFHPTAYLDITALEPLKRQACFAHKSQSPEEFYAYHERMSRFRGLESGVQHAEAFVAYSGNIRTESGLPGL